MRKKRNLYYILLIKDESIDIVLLRIKWVNLKVLKEGLIVYKLGIRR